MQTVESITAEYLRRIRKPEYLEQSEKRKKDHLKIYKPGFVMDLAFFSMVTDTNSIDITIHPYEKNQKNLDFFHKHNYYEIIYVYQGNACNCFSDSEISLKKDDILLLTPDVPHNIFTETQDDVVFNIMLHESLFDQSFLMRLDKKNIVNYFYSNFSLPVNKRRKYLLFHSCSEHNSAAMLNALIEEYFNKSPGFEKVMESYLSLAFGIMARSFKEDEPETKMLRRQQDQIALILEYINKNYKTATLQSTADHFNYSEKYLSRLIKQHTDLTFSSIVSNYKLTLAKDYLINTSLPIESIAVMAGFQDKNYFHRIFKKKFDQTPDHFRKAHQKNMPGK